MSVTVSQRHQPNGSAAVAHRSDSPESHLHHRTHVGVLVSCHKHVDALAHHALHQRRVHGLPHHVGHAAVGRRHLVGRSQPQSHPAALGTKMWRHANGLEHDREPKTLPGNSGSAGVGNQLPRGQRQSCRRRQIGHFAPRQPASVRVIGQHPIHQGTQRLHGDVGWTCREHPGILVPPGAMVGQQSHHPHSVIGKVEQRDARPTRHQRLGGAGPQEGGHGGHRTRRRRPDGCCHLAALVSHGRGIDDHRGVHIGVGHRGHGGGVVVGAGVKRQIDGTAIATATAATATATATATAATADNVQPGGDAGIQSQ